MLRFAKMTVWAIAVLSLVFLVSPATAQDTKVAARSQEVDGWKLDLNNFAEASIEPIANSDASLRISVNGPAREEKPSTVQVSHELLSTEEGGIYEVSFVAKAAENRRIYFGVIEDEAPWNGIGVYEPIDLTNKWKRVTKRFKATKSVGRPRILFQVGSYPGAVELAEISFSGKWVLYAQEGSSAELFRLITDPSVLRVRILKLGEGESASRASLFRPDIEVEKDKQYTVAFRGKARKSRPIRVAAGLADAPYSPLGFYRKVDLTEEWQAFSFPFQSNADAKNARLYFELGDGESGIEVSDVSLFSSDWKVVAQQGAQASLFRPLDTPEVLRVKIEKIAEPAAAWHVQAAKEGIQVEKDKEYLVKFRVRADQPRTVNVAVGQAVKPFKTLGLYSRIEVTPEWKEVESKFKATAAEESARIYFDMGTDGAGVEISEVELQPASDQEPKEEGK